MNNYRVAFNFLDRDDHAPVGNNDITCHLILDVKMDLIRKSRYVSGDHITDLPSPMIYASVVSRDIVLLAFRITALNDLNILAGDIQKAYFNDPKNRKYVSTLEMNVNLTKGKLLLLLELYMV